MKSQNIKRIWNIKKQKALNKNQAHDKCTDGDRHRSGADHDFRKGNDWEFVARDEKAIGSVHSDSAKKVKASRNFTAHRHDSCWQNPAKVNVRNHYQNFNRYHSPHLLSEHFSAQTSESWDQLHLAQ